MRNIVLVSGHDGPVVETSFAAIWQSAAFSLGDISVGNLTVDYLVRTTPLILISKILDATGVAPEAHRAALSQSLNCLTDQGQLALGYSKNMIATLAEFTTRAAAAQTLCNAAMERILGSTAYTKFQAATFENALVQAGMASVMPSNSRPAASPSSSAWTVTPQTKPAVGTTRRFAAERGTFKPTKESARDFLRMFLEPGADQANLTLQLRPTRDDYNDVFTEPAATQLFEAQREIFVSEVIHSGPDQIDVLVSFGNTNDFIDRSANAEIFAGGWDSVRVYLKRDVPVIKFRFVRPGETLGTTYEGLFYVGERWVLMPAPWRFLRQ